MPEAIIPVLRTFPMFAEAKESTLRALVPNCVFQSFSAGITINKTGEVPAYIYCLRSGSVEGWARLNDAETILASATAPMVFEVATAIQNHPSVLAIVTREQCETIAIETSAFLQSIHDDQAVCHAALIHASQINLMMIDRLLDHKLRTAEERLGRWIISKIDPIKKLNTVQIEFSKRALAYELGMSPANLSRLFALIRDHGVEVKGMTISVGDITKLKRLAGE